MKLHRFHPEKNQPSQEKGSDQMMSGKRISASERTDRVQTIEAG